MPSSVVFICLIPFNLCKLTFGCRKIIPLFLANQISVRLQALATLGMRMVQLSRTRVNSPEKSIMVERIKPPDEKVDKTVFVCKWILACQEAEVENIIEIINIADENKNYDNNDINLMAADTKDDVKSKENIEAVIENENDYKNESYLMVLDKEKLTIKEI